MAAALPTSLSSISRKPMAYQPVLTNWLKAVNAFQLSYNQLQQHPPQPMLTDQLNLYVSQCSQHQVPQLLQQMQQELTVLLADFDAHSSLSSLVAHTKRLNALTDRARVTLTLSGQSSC